MEMYTITNDVWEFPSNSIANARVIRTDRYTFSAVNPGTLYVNRNGAEKLVKIVPDREFTFKLMKTMIKANEGVNGLIRFMTDPFWQDAAVLIMDHAIDNMKPVKTC